MSTSQKVSIRSSLRKFFIGLLVSMHEVTTMAQTLVTANAAYVNQPLTLWGQYKKEVITAALALALLSMLLAHIWRLNIRLAHAKSAVELSEARFRALVEQAPEAIIVYDLDQQRIVDANARALTLFGCSRATLLAGGPERFYATQQPDDANVMQSIATHGQRAFSGEEVRFERIVRQGDGQQRRCDVRVVPLPHRAQRLVRASFVDASERHQAEQALQASIREKVALLNEVHHRVNNNLQVITSLLRLETIRSQDTKTKGVLTEMQGRIRSMALLHESLYRSGVFAAVDLGAYVKQLVTQSFRALGNPNHAIGLELDLAPIQVGMDQATACGLLVNELVSNSLKHGFPDGLSGHLRVTLKPLPALAAGPTQVRLCVSDTGVGLGLDFDIQQVNSLGLQLACDLSRQLGGTLQVEAGSTFSMTFPIHESALANQAKANLA